MIGGSVGITQRKQPRNGTRQQFTGGVTGSQNGTCPMCAAFAVRGVFRQAQQDFGFGAERGLSAFAPVERQPKHPRIKGDLAVEAGNQQVDVSQAGGCGNSLKPCALDKGVLSAMWFAPIVCQFYKAGL